MKNLRKLLMKKWKKEQNNLSNINKNPLNSLNLEDFC